MSKQLLTTEKFIIKAKKTHGDLYDYSRVEYKNCKTNVEIGCGEHGFYWQRPTRHTSGKHCPKCATEESRKSQTHTTKGFIKSAKAMHGDLYDYSRVDYKNATTKVEIGCEEHGFTWQRPIIHIQGVGCFKCGHIIKGKHKSLSLENFIKRVRAVHGDLYDYSRVDYKTGNIDIEIGCEEHGFFWQLPRCHWRGSGCPECALARNNIATTKTTSTFIHDAIIIHGDLYDYSRVDYKNNNTEVEIGCKEHGYFWQKPRNHLMQNGCSTCSAIARSKRQTMPLNVFITRARAVHGNLYDYSRVDYKNCRIKVEIGCEEHGFFLQSPSAHIVGHGCQRCGELKSSVAFHPLPTMLYYIKVTDLDGTEYWKIGITTQTLKQRFCNRGEWDHIEVIWTEQFPLGREAWLLEQEILRRFTMHRPCRPISVLQGGHTEIFTKNVLPLVNGVVTLG